MDAVADAAADVVIANPQSNDRAIDDDVNIVKNTAEQPGNEGESAMCTAFRNDRSSPCFVYKPKPNPKTKSTPKPKFKCISNALKPNLNVPQHI